MEVAGASGCTAGLRRLLLSDPAGPILWVLHRFTLLHVHLGGEDDPTCLVAQHCLPAPVVRQPHSPLCGNESQEMPFPLQNIKPTFLFDVGACPA